VRTATGDLDKEIAKFKADPANKDKEFDVKAWATAHNFTHWITPEQTIDKYKNGKLEVNATDVKVGADVFELSKPIQRQGMEAFNADRKKRMDEFTSLSWIDPNKPELGGIIARKAKFNESKEKTLEEAKPKIIEMLKVTESVKLAQEEAKKAHDKWAK